jgi:Right handed beta helix region
VRKAVVVAGTVILGVAVFAVPASLAPRAASVAAELPEPYLYVGQRLCTATQDGTKAHPFCTISAAAAAVEPGQTVVVAGGNYDESVSITRSGTPAAPIRFVTFRSFYTSDLARITGGPDPTAAAFALSGVHDVTISGFVVSGKRYGVLVDGSTDVTVDNGAAVGTGAPGIRITGASQRVRVTRMSVKGSAGASGNLAAIAVDSGATDTLISANTISSSTAQRPGQPALARTGVLVTDSPHTTLVGNTLVSYCAAGITLTGTSQGAVIENNIVETASSATGTPTACAAPALAAGVTVDATSAPGTVADFNLIDPASGGALYAWAGVGYSSIASFSNATGQGGHDIAADPRLSNEAGGDLWYDPIKADSPAIDSADSDAPGALPTDMMDNAFEDNPAVSNSGRGLGYADRGAVEWVSQSVGGGNLTRKKGGGPLEVVATVSWKPTQVTSGVIGTTLFKFEEDPWPIGTKDLQVEHSFRTAGKRCVTIATNRDGFRTGTGTGGSTCTMVGAGYTPVTPRRVLDTRTAIGVATRTPVLAGKDAVLNLPSIDGVAAADISAVVLSVTVTQPTAGGFLSVLPGSAEVPATSNLNFVAGQTVANLVTTQLYQGGIWFHNGSTGTVHMVADLQGYYGATGGGFASRPPTRVLDTRSGIGAPTGTVAAGATLRLDLSAKVPSGAIAAALNLTVTQPRASGYLTVYPSGQPRPATSNLNFLPGDTRANLVIVPLSDGKVNLYNGSGGTVHLVADLAGFYGDAASGATATFVPTWPVRITDTRTALGVNINPPQPLPAHYATPTWPTVDWYACQPTCPLAYALNVTATQPTAVGFLAVYPYSYESPKPPTASTLNFAAKQTVPNAAIVSDGAGIGLYNGSSGTTHVVVDQQGYFIAPPA